MDDMLECIKIFSINSSKVPWYSTKWTIEELNRESLRLGPLSLEG
jgi:hypothetical protein